MSKKSVSMDRVYDIFAEETRKQARLYGVDLTDKKQTVTRGKKNEVSEIRRKATKSLETA